MVKSTKTKYTNKELNFVFHEILNTLAKLSYYCVKTSTAFPYKYKKVIINDFENIFGTNHSHDSIKMLIDNFLSNMNVKGAEAFGKGSKAVQEIVARFFYIYDIRKIGIDKII